MADKDNAGVTITYQGKPCSPIFEFSRRVGLEPDFGFVVMSKPDFKEFVIRESLPGQDYLGASGTQDRSRGFQSAGQLVYQELEFDAQGQVKDTHKVVWDMTLLTERGIEVAFADDTPENETCRLETTDIRYLWRTRGILSALVNIPEQGNPAKVSGSQEKNPADPLKALTDAAQGGGPAAGALAGATQALAGSGATAPKLLPGSTNEGKPWTVETLLKRKILPALPGTPQLKIQDPRPAFFDKVVGPKTWDCILTRDALAQVLDEFQLVLSLDLRTVSVKGRECAQVRIWDKDSGSIALDDGTDLKVFTKAGELDASNRDPRIAAARKVVTFKHVPACVVVIGAPRIKATKLRLEPVGQSSSGEIVPLEDALKEIGLDMERATQFALLTHEQRSTHLGVTQRGVSEFGRWAFKWFRLPGGAKVHADKLPILPSTAVVDEVTGAFVPLRVFSESYTVARPLDFYHSLAAIVIPAKIRKLESDVEDLQQRELNAGTPAETNALKDRIKELQGQIEKNQKELDAFKFAPPEPTFIEALLAATAEIKAAEQGGENAAAGALAGAAAALAGAVAARSKLDNYRVTVNIPFSQQSASSYEIDHQNGLVKFSSVQGHLFKDGIPLEKTYLLKDARVELEFSYREKPTRDEDLTIGFRYNLAVTRESGQIVQRREIPEGCAPVKVFRPELQEVVSLDGSSNRAKLDAVALAIAKDRLLVPQSFVGAIVEFGRPVPILNSGTVLSVTWSYGPNELPETVAHVGTFDRYATVPGVHHTRAFGGNGGLSDFDGGVMRGSIFYPGGGS